MNNDLRDSLKLWAGAIVFGALFWIFARSDVLRGAVDSSWQMVLARLWSPRRLEHGKTDLGLVATSGF